MSGTTGSRITIIVDPDRLTPFRVHTDYSSPRKVGPRVGYVSGSQYLPVSQTGGRQRSGHIVSYTGRLFTVLLLV